MRLAVSISFLCDDIFSPRVGGVSKIALKARIIAATNRDLFSEVNKERFREDLYFRLNVIHIKVPPLRERREDIPSLVKYFMCRFNQIYKKKMTMISQEAMTLFYQARWSGNVRELRNTIERIIVLEEGDCIEAKHLPANIRYNESLNYGRQTFLLPENGINLDEVETSFISQAMEISEGNQTKAAELLGISRFALRYRLKKNGWLK